MTEAPTARTYPCPACRRLADLDRGCAGCGRPPDPDAAEVARLDSVLDELTARELQWRIGYAAVAAELADTRARRDALAARLVSAARRPAAPAYPPPPPPAPPAAGAASTELTTRTAQAVLFVLGGLLLGVGAIVFTAVAWSTFGVTGRAVLLATVTAVVLSVPLAVARRGLRGTAETFAALGLLLVLLDGFAIWSVDLLGVRGMAPATWVALVFAGAAAVAVGYARGTGLTGPRYAALLLVQPVLPLLVVEVRPGAAGWGYVWAGLAWVNLAVRWWLRGAEAGRRVLAWVLTGAAVVIAAPVTGWAVVAAGEVLAAAVAGGALLAAAAVPAGVALLTGGSVWRATAAGVAVVAVAGVAVRVALLATPGHPLVVTAAVVGVVAAAAALTWRRWPLVGRGARVGALLAVGAVGTVLGTAALAYAVAAVAVAWLGTGPADLFDWQLPLALLIMSTALMALVPVGWREITAVGLAVTVLSAPVALGLVWWAPVVLGLLAATALGLAAAQVRGSRAAVVCALAATPLAGHALVVALPATISTAAALGVLVLSGTAVAARAARATPPATPPAGQPATPPAGPPAGFARLAVGRGALLVGLLAVPGAAAATVAAAGAGPGWPSRAALAACLLLLVAVATVARTVPAYLSTAAGAVHVTTPVALLGGLAEPAMAGGYAGGALLVLAGTAWLRRPAHPAWWLAARAPAALLVVAVAAGQVAVVLVGPHEWWGHIWQGAPSGSGVSVSIGWPDRAAGPVGLALLTIAVLLAGRVLRRPHRVGAALLVAPLALVVGLAQLDLTWPVVPATSLVVGLVALSAAALPGVMARQRSGRGADGAAGRGGGAAAAMATGYGLVFAGAGLAGALATRWSTVAALAVTLAVTVVIGWAGRTIAARVAGWLAAVTVAVSLVIAAGEAADLPLATTGLAVLAAAMVALAAGGLRRQRRAEAVALEAAAHAAALMALLLSAGALSRAAVIAALWGLALGLRTLWPAEAVAGRVGRAGAALGVELVAWWLLLASREVVTIEAYTLPAALVAGGVGVLAIRTRPQLGSWVAMGPALAGGFLPSLYASLGDPQPLRRLLLGAAAAAVVAVGASRRWQAAVVVGGGMVAVVALRELVLVGQQVAAWIPLTVAGLVLVALAATYERRRRDLTRLRDAVRGMS